MRRRMFATAVAFVVMATPLFGAQGASSPQRTNGAATPQAAAAKPDQKKLATEAKKPAETAAAQKPASPKPPAPATAKTAPASPKPSAVVPAKGAPAAPKAPTVRLAVSPQKSDVRPSAPAVAKAAAIAKAPAGPLSPVQEKVHQNKELTKELQTRLPGADVVSAAEGFKDLPQFVSAAHASHNLSIPFGSLKAKLLNGKRTSLRQAIQELRPAASAAIEAQRAQYDAGGMIRATEQAQAAAAAEAASKAKPAAPSKPKSSSPQPK